MDNSTLITRRALMKASAAIVATTALPVVVNAAAPGAIATAIDAHRQAYDAYESACVRQGAIAASLKKHENPLVPVIVYPDGTPGELNELGAYSAEEIGQFITNRHAELRKLHCGNWATRMAPAYVEDLRRQIDASEARAFKGLERAIANNNAAEEKAGLPRAEAEVDRTGIAEMHARVALVLCRPSDEFDADRKAEYMAKAVPFAGNWCCEEDFTKALISTLGEVAR